jgi:argonaute-like protein implicated in RNA metabolism and viral defense
MGGIPFVMAAQSPIAHELVFGIGSAVVGAREGVAGERVVGITSVFQADGNYLLSHRSREASYAAYPEELAATLRQTVNAIEARNGWQPGDTVRLIFHGFNRMRDEDAKAIKALVDGLGLYRVEYAFVHINEHHEWFLFDTSDQKANAYLVPDRGLTLPLGRREVLVTVTGSRELRNRREAAPKPLLLELHRESTFQDLDYLAQQVFRFTAISWRSFTPVALPITVGYSDRIASLLGRLREVPNWNPDVLDTAMRRSLWFL